MRKLVIFAAIFALLGNSAGAETIKASVNGLVCSFCATSIEKTFKAHAAVDTVKVDLNDKLVTVHTKADQTLDDNTVTKLITDAGYSVTRIARER